jgi:ankyrin repeat protein
VKLINILYYVFVLFFTNGYAQDSLFIEHNINTKIDTSYFTGSDKDYNLAISVLKNNEAAIKMLLDQGANPNIMLNDGFIPLIYAAQEGKLKICSLLIEKGAIVDTRSANGQTALFAAVRNRHLKVAEFLINKDTDINTRDFLGRTPLLYAAAYGDSLMCVKLLSCNANLAIKDDDEVNALMAAVINNRINIVSLLVQKGMSVNTKDINGMTPLMIACGNGNIKLANLLIKNKAEINTVNNNENSLTIAILHNNYEMVEFLIENGADVNQKLNAAETPLSVARYYNADKQIIDLLLSHGATQNNLPDFRMFTFGPEFNFNWTDYMNGITIGLKELKYNFEINAGFQFRLFANRILTKYAPNIYYQFWETRSLVYLGLNKNFSINCPGKIIQGFNIGLNEAYTYGSDKGTDISAKNLFILIPEVGVYHIFKGVELGLNYNYTNLNITNISPHRFIFVVKIIFGSVKGFDSSKYKMWE